MTIITTQKKDCQEEESFQTSTLLLIGTSDQTNNFLWIGNKFCTCRTHILHTQFNIWTLCVQNVCVCFQSSTEQSLSTRPWFVLGTASWVATPPEREKENTMKTGSRFLDDIKKKKKNMRGRDGLCGFATIATLGNGLYCNKPCQKQK